MRRKLELKFVLFSTEYHNPSNYFTLLPCRDQKEKELPKQPFLIQAHIRIKLNYCPFNDDNAHTFCFPQGDH
jgi:hypothetical protein